MSNIVNVLLVSPIPPPVGGIATWTILYKKWIIDNNYTVNIVNTAVRGNRINDLSNRKNKILEIHRAILILYDLLIKLWKCKPNIVHLNTSCAKNGILRDIIIAIIIKLSNKKLFIQYHCNIEDQITNNKIQNQLFRILAKVADVNFVLNATSKSYLESKTNRSGIKVNNFIDENFILNNTKPIKEEIKIVSYVGHVKKNKGIFEIIETAKNFPLIEFRLAGPIDLEITNSNIPSNIILLGSITNKEVKNLLLISDIFLFPSYTEGFAKAILEAMASGLPIITTPVGANVEMIESSGGVIVEIGNSNELISAINHLQDTRLRAAMSKWNLNKVKSEYTINKVMSDLLNTYLNRK